MNGRSYVYMYAARFTPDGHYLLVMSSVPDTRIYDVFSGQLVNHLPHVPNNAAAYYPSSDWKHSVVALSTGEIKLIEADAGRTLAQIDFGDQLQSVSYSPDGSQVAVVTVGHDADGSYRCHLRIWRTSTGEMLHELRPLEATPRDGFGEPVWTPDGKYLLSSTREGHFAGPSVVGIWNTESGRYRGALAGCMYLDTPFTRFLLSGKYFYKTCSSYDVLMWNVENALKEISGFEKSLPN
jgi:WD40 repeat protein